MPTALGSVVSVLRNTTLDNGCELRNYTAMNKSHLSELLKSRGLRLTDLARQLKVNKATVTRWAQGGVPVERLSKIEEKTGIPSREIRPDLAAVFASEPERAA